MCATEVPPPLCSQVPTSSADRPCATRTPLSLLLHLLLRLILSPPLALLYFLFLFFSLSYCNLNSFHLHPTYSSHFFFPPSSHPQCLRGESGRSSTRRDQTHETHPRGEDSPIGRLTHQPLQREPDTHQHHHGFLASCQFTSHTAKGRFHKKNAEKCGELSNQGGVTPNQTLFLKKKVFSGTT